MQLTKEELRDLHLAKYRLENPAGFAIKLTNSMGKSIDFVMDKAGMLLPAGWADNVGKITRNALMKSLNGAVFTMQDTPGEQASPLWHKVSVAATGGVGGFFGVAALAVELPLSTTLILRSVADIARSEGESIAAAETQMACLEVFALGGNGKADDEAESGYYGVRGVLASIMSDAASHVAKHGLTKDAGPTLVKAVALVAERFGVQVSQKAAAQAVPAVGAVAGAAVNLLFIDHFQTMARGHFLVRRLERKYGVEQVREAYLAVPGGDGDGGTTDFPRVHRVPVSLDQKGE